MTLDELQGRLSRAASRVQHYMPDWLSAALTYAAAAVVALALARIVQTLLNRAAERRELFWRSLVGRGAQPVRLMLLVIALAIANSLAPVSPAQAAVVGRILTVALVLALAWLAHSAIYIWTTIHLRRFRLDTEDNLMARKHVTQARILMRVSQIVVAVLAVAAALMTFPAVRQYGVSLLAAGGAASVVVGLALQPLLKNLFAGIQLAITQPIRIDDALIVDGEWGNVEEITSTYVVIRIWDWRRLVVPLSYFIERPFQNWTRESAELIGTVMIYVDLAADVGAIRAKAQEIVGASPLWDGKVFAVQVTDFEKREMQVRILASAKNGGATFDLRCEIREKLIGWLQAEMPAALPRTRGEVALRGEAAALRRAAE